jgi:hypothetical protein
MSFPLLALVACMAAPPRTKVDVPTEATFFRSANWVVVNSLREVNPTVVEVLRDRIGRDDRLADRGEPFDATCIVAGHPSRRLVLAGYTGSRWFIAYEVGGRAHHIVLVTFEMTETAPTITMLARGSPGEHDDERGWQLNLEEIRDALLSGSLRLDDTSEDYY